jgi:signal transduction histidine kinase
MSSTLQELAHDLSQPLTVIETTAYCLELLLPEDNPAIAAHLQLIRQQVELAGRILSAAQAGESSLSRSRTKAAMAGVTY